MLLKQLLKNLDYTLVQGCLNTEVTDIYYDSRKVTPGGLFVCIVGTQRDSHDYAADVAAKGAAVLAIQHDLPAEVLAALPDVTVVKFESTRYAMALLSTAYFGRPALEMTMVGVTGTKGKTTTTHMIKAVLEAAGHKVGMVGTNGVYYPGHHYDLNNTTPESYELQKILRQLADAGSEIQQNALEAHGEASGIAELAEQRIYSIRQGREIKGLSRLSEVIADLYTELDERARSDSEIPGMSTGWTRR